MAVPRARKTKGATKRRRSHQALSRIFLAQCKNCGAAARPHEICRNCGYYRGKEVITKAEAAAKK